MIDDEKIIEMFYERHQQGIRNQMLICVACGTDIFWI